MVLLIFRLNKDTGCDAVTFTLGKSLKFSKLKFLGYTHEHCDNLAGSLAPATQSDLPIYLQCSLFNDNTVVFYQGKNTTLNVTGETNIGNMLPLGGAREGRDGFRPIELTIIDQMTTFEATKQITFSLKMIHQQSISVLSNAQAFGSVVDTAGPPLGPYAYDHGINLYFEATTLSSHDEEQSFNIADATS